MSQQESSSSAAATDEPAAVPDDAATGAPTAGETPAPGAGDEPAAGTDAPGSRGARRLIEEGEVAADYLEELLDIADLDGDIDIDVENGRAAVSVVAEDASARQLRRLAGEDGLVLEALQELTRLAVQTRTGERSRLMLDVAGFRARRRKDLEALTERACREVERTGEPVALEPMTPFERKVVHDAVASAGLRSDSEGVEPQRHVVIHRQ